MSASTQKITQFLSSDARNSENAVPSENKLSSLLKIGQMLQSGSPRTQRNVLSRLQNIIDGDDSPSNVTYLPMPAISSQTSPDINDDADYFSSPDFGDNDMMNMSPAVNQANTPSQPEKSASPEKTSATETAEKRPRALPKKIRQLLNAFSRQMTISKPLAKAIHEGDSREKQEVKVKLSKISNTTNRKGKSTIRFFVEATYQDAPANTAVSRTTPSHR